MVLKITQRDYPLNVSSVCIQLSVLIRLLPWNAAHMPPAEVNLNPIMQFSRTLLPQKSSESVHETTNPPHIYMEITSGKRINHSYLANARDYGDFAVKMG